MYVTPGALKNTLRSPMSMIISGPWGNKANYSLGEHKNAKSVGPIHIL